MAIEIITAPTAEPISLVEAKAQLRVDGIDEDTFISSIIKAAREYCEDFQGRAYVSRVYDLWLDGWPCKDYIRILRPPLQTLTSIKYYGTDDTEYTMAATDYFVDAKSEPARVVLAYNKSWPSLTLRPANGVVVRFTAGYPATTAVPPDPAGNVPQKMKQAMLMLIGHWFENREAVLTGSIPKELEFTTKVLLWQDRVTLS